MKGADYFRRNSLPLGCRRETRPALARLCPDTIILEDGDDELSIQLGG
jgi:hypothetical protein